MVPQQGTMKRENLVFGEVSWPPPRGAQSESLAS